METKPERVTFSKTGNDQLLYFTTSSLSGNDDALWFLSDRDGHPNVYRHERATGETRPLTRNAEGTLWQYVSFAGERGRGLGLWSVALDQRSRTLYTIVHDEILAIDEKGTPRLLGRVEAGQTTGFIDVSSCGRWLCVPTTDERALLHPFPGGLPPGASKDIDRRCQDEGLCSFLDVFDTTTGERALHLSVPRCWITHVQFRPDRPNEILYNHEWAGTSGNRRMWLWDGVRHRCLRPAAEGRSPEDWICHEVWSPDGNHVVYHGGFHGGPALIGRMEIETGVRVEIPLPEGWNRYGHFHPHPSREDLLVSDGYFQTEDDLPGKGRWISLQRVDWTRGTVEWIPLCRHGSSWAEQGDHPHPIFDADGRFVYFTGATEDGRRAVYRVATGEGR